MAKVQAALLQLLYGDVPVAGSTEQAVCHTGAASDDLWELKGRFTPKVDEMSVVERA